MYFYPFCLVLILLFLYNHLKLDMGFELFIIYFGAYFYLFLSRFTCVMYYLIIAELGTHIHASYRLTYWVIELGCDYR